MIIDPSAVTRGLLTRIMEAEDISIAGSAGSGAAALGLLKHDAPHRVEPDIILMDALVPDINGTNAIAALKAASPRSKIIVTSTLNEQNVLSCMDALDKGADELVAKPSSRKNTDDNNAFTSELLEKIENLMATDKPESPLPAAILPRKLQENDDYTLRKKPSFFRPKALAIASSTGGPKALQIFFEGVNGRLKGLPIFITQHMPKDFTNSLAGQISRHAGQPCIEATDGMRVADGVIHLAPGDFHMLAERRGTEVEITLNQDPPENFCRPAADPMLRSLFKVYGKDVLVVVFTGMGQDGMLGAKLFADNGAVVMAQDKSTSVVWGMPGAAAKEGICTYVLPVQQMADAVVKICNGVLP